MTRTRDPRGTKVVLAAKVTLSSLFVGMALWVVVSAFLDDPPLMPGHLWALGALVPLVGLGLTWRPEERVPDLFFYLGVSAFLIGLVGVMWKSRVAPVLGLTTLVGLLVAPRKPKHP